MTLNVRTKSLVIPILIILILIIAAVYGMNALNVEKSTAGYDYKAQLFIEDEIGIVDITVSENNWNKILENPTAEEYVEASVTVNGSTYDNVGVRAKGNSSLTSVANSDSERYSLKLDFAQYDTNQTYYGLEKINLNNNFSDTTQMKEFVSYELMEQLGIATPAHSYVKVMVNGQYYALMLAVEEVGEAFAKTNYGSTEGFIFKPEGNGSDLAYVSDDVNNYDGIFSEVKMNKKTAENNSDIITMMKEISEGDTSSLDIEKIAAYFALNTALVNMDSYQGSFKHNYYLYENEDGIFSVIPWDYNMSFGGFSGGGGGPDQNADANEAAQSNGEKGIGEEGNQNAQQLAPPDANQQKTNQMQQPNRQQQDQANEQQKAEAQGEQNEQQNNGRGMNGQRGGGGGLMMGQNMMTDSNINFSIIEPVSGTTIDARPLLKIILEDEQARAIYDAYLEQIATEILTEENVQAITTKLGDLLAQAVEEDPSKFGTTEQFLAGVSGEESLAEFAKQRSESILKQLAGEIEGVSGAGSSGMPSFGGNGGQEMNGEMPNFENMPEMNGEQGVGGPPQMNGEMPNFENMPERNGEQGAGGPPQMPGGGQPGEMNVQQVNETNPTQTAILLGASVVIILLAILFIVFLSKRKYKKG